MRLSMISVAATLSTKTRRHLVIAPLFIQITDGTEQQVCCSAASDAQNHKRSILPPPLRTLARHCSLSLSSDTPLVRALVSDPEAEEDNDSPLQEP